MGPKAVVCGSQNRLPLSLNWSARRCRTSGFSTVDISLLATNRQNSVWTQDKQGGAPCQRNHGPSVLAVPAYLLLRQKASWTFRRGVIPFAFGTDPILIIPGNTRTNAPEQSLQRLHDTNLPTPEPPEAWDAAQHGS